MPRSLLALLLLFSALLTPLHAAPPAWVEVRSPHFTVYTDAGEKQGVHVAGQFERMHSVFRTLFPDSNGDSVAPIVVVAARTRKGFQALLPSSYLEKGALNLAGLFLRTPDTSYILIRLDAEGEHPFSTVYHEYTHVLISPDDAWMPLWLNEGLAQFFQNTEIRNNEVLLGEISVNELLYLRQVRLLPLTTLFRVDHTSPYYHEEQKGSVFYAESWALTHYLEINDRKTGSARVARYATLMKGGKDSVEAATEAFGDLKQLQKALESYIFTSNFQSLRMQGETPVSESAFKVQPISQVDADALRATILVFNQREDEARTLLSAILQQEPRNVLAHETMGFLEFRRGNFTGARKWYGEAVELDSKNYLAHYYYAAMSLQGGTADETESKAVESSLRTAIRLNPKFAPAYDELALLLGREKQHLDEAHLLNVQASELDPGNLNFRLNTGSVLMEASRYADAHHVLEAAKPLAKTPQQIAMLDGRIDELERFQAARAAMVNPDGQNGEPTGKNPAAAGSLIDSAAAGASEPPPSLHPDQPLAGPMHVARGVIRGVRCSQPAVLELRVEGTGKPIALYSNNYYKLAYSASNYTPEGEIHPCSDLEGKKARIEYAPTPDKTADGQIATVELSR